MRGKQTTGRQRKPDEVYNSAFVSKFINYVMQHGKKHVAAKAVYEAIDMLGEKTKAKDKKEKLERLEKAFSNVQPHTEVRSKRVGGSNFQVPMPVAPARQEFLALRWIIEAARRSRGSKPFSNALAKQLLDAYNGEGDAVRKKEEVLKMAEANKAFAQFA